MPVLCHPGECPVFHKNSQNGAPYVCTPSPSRFSRRLDAGVKASRRQEVQMHAQKYSGCPVSTTNAPLGAVAESSRCPRTVCVPIPQMHRSRQPVRRDRESIIDVTCVDAQGKVVWVGRTLHEPNNGSVGQMVRIGMEWINYSLRDRTSKHNTLQCNKPSGEALKEER